MKQTIETRGSRGLPPKNRKAVAGPSFKTVFWLGLFAVMAYVLAWIIMLTHPQP